LRQGQESYEMRKNKPFSFCKGLSFFINQDPMKTAK